MNTTKNYTVLTQNELASMKARANLIDISTSPLTQPIPTNPRKKNSISSAKNEPISGPIITGTSKDEKRRRGSGSSRGKSSNAAEWTKKKGYSSKSKKKNNLKRQTIKFSKIAKESGL